MKYTVIYTTSNQWGALVYVKHITTRKNKSFEQALNDNSIELGQVVQVFYGHQEPISSDWSNL
jgi:hypothetical protein